MGERPSYDRHFAPTYASWLNQVERWLGLVGEQALTRGQGIHEERQ